MPNSDGFDPDEELAFVQRAMRREADAMHEFARRMDCILRMMSALNARMGRPFSTDELGDLVQDTVVVVLKKLPEFEARSDLEGWVYRICQYEFMNRVRAKRRDADRQRELESRTDPNDQVEAGNPAIIEQESLRAALDRIDPTDAEIVTLKVFEGLTFDEISQRLGIANGTAKSRYYAAMRRLKDFLDESGGSDA